MSNPRRRQTKADRIFDPPKSELSYAVQTMTVVAIARIYGVSRATVHKRCREHGIVMPSIKRPLKPYARTKKVDGQIMQSEDSTTRITELRRRV